MVKKILFPEYLVEVNTKLGIVTPSPTVYPWQLDDQRMVTQPWITLSQLCPAMNGAELQLQLSCPPIYHHANQAANMGLD